MGISKLTCDAPGEAGQVRIGVDIGGTDVKLGLVDAEHQIIALEVIPTRAERPAEEVAADIGCHALSLLARRGVPLEQCMSAGISVPGTVDRKNGTVLYANNLRWEDVPLAALLRKYLPMPIQMANDADCAALGEMIAGGGSGCRNLVMITLGTGVGGGVILDGKIASGSELGHMVIVENGEPCTCGRRGCLEAYCSATALKREAKRAAGTDMQPEKIFAAAAAGDPVLGAVVQSYIRRLGAGIVNIVNILRPQMVLIGGGLSQQGETLLNPIREMVRAESYGGEKGVLPEIRAANLGNQAGIIGAAGLTDDALSSGQ